jgi:hypothetical protein
LKPYRSRKQVYQKKSKSDRHSGRQTESRKQNVEVKNEMTKKNKTKSFLFTQAAQTGLKRQKKRFSRLLQKITSSVRITGFF